MGLKLYGYLIGKDIHFDIENKRLYRVSLTGNEKNVAFCATNINDTMMHLFLYLLINARTKMVTKDELLKKIWEDNNLTSSTQRLWQVLNGLSAKLNLLGLPADFIKNTKGQGYIITYDEVMPLYYKASEYHYSFGLHTREFK
ncbi:winged helix-turn-helix domain-containing protein [Buttiauxella selenatireducens]|uniref:Winged helix-turn-helix domain-containing protein n=1 Tax=Buttiauxella selenatireducens TaxID=3073902 RepID=A0ABY9S7R4_9ENTR|nr:winged helix-turn-helix domain-containing protein [Buttiauxella sp. R73]WMY73540.1 winged helix-turn-helix domain-containing protein [Buttiauxella sp. R73]